MAETAFSTYRVLVVDDDPFMVNLTGKLLDRLGVASHRSAEDGHAALAILDEPDSAFDIILCDLNMPGMDGLEFMRHLASRGSDAGIVLISGEDERLLESAGSLARAHKLDMLGVLGKPVKPDNLKALIGQYQPKAADGRTAAVGGIPVSEADLRAALDGGQFVPVFQPKVDIASRAIKGVETLLRWHHPERGVIGPGSFIPLAEELGLIEEMTFQVLANALKATADWKAAGLDTHVAVNFSVDTLKQLDLPERIMEAANAVGMDPQALTIEVTESRLMEDPTAPMEILTRLRMKGIGVSIDDFGTGYSSMEQLKALPFTELKIDRAFVCGAAEDRAARAILESSIDLARKLGLSIVAEGVETDSDWSLVAELGCDLVQGYYIARPMAGSEIVPWASSTA